MFPSSLPFVLSYLIVVLAIQQDLSLSPSSPQLSTRESIIPYDSHTATDLSDVRDPNIAVNKRDIAVPFEYQLGRRAADDFCNWLSRENKTLYQNSQHIALALHYSDYIFDIKVNCTGPGCEKYTFCDVQNNAACKAHLANILNICESFHILNIWMGLTKTGCTMESKGCYYNQFNGGSSTLNDTQYTIQRRRTEDGAWALAPSWPSEVTCHNNTGTRKQILPDINTRAFITSFCETRGSLSQGMSASQVLGHAYLLVTAHKDDKHSKCQNGLDFQNHTSLYPSFREYCESALWYIVNVICKFYLSNAVQQDATISNVIN